MDNIRLFLFGGLALVLIMMYQAWQRDYGPQPQPVIEADAPTSETVNRGISGAVPDVRTVAPESAASATSVPQAMEMVTAPGIKIITDLLDVEIGTQGGDILNVFLRDYPLTKENPDVKFKLMNSGTVNRFIAQSGLIGANKERAPTHEALFQPEQQEYRLADGEEAIEAVLTWHHPSGITVNKRYTFKRGSYEVELRHEVINNSDSDWAARIYHQLQRSRPPDGEGNRFLYTYTGPAIYTQEDKYEKYSFDDIDDAQLSRDTAGGWIAMIQHYFLGAWIPPADEKTHLYTNKLPNNRYLVGMYSPLVKVAAGSSHDFTSKMFVGPKLQAEMEATAPGLELTVDYGWLTVLAKPIYWLLQQMYSISQNWGWAIIFLTIIIKGLFYKLSEASYKSMANMRKLAPRMKALKDRYGDDKAKMNQATMELYKKEKINPLSGCLPIMVQIPVFIALYWVLLESVELRQAPFIFWLDDLSKEDPYYVLPFLMAASMFVQQKLNPAPLDPMQAKIMMSLPFIFGIFFAFFPSGLVLYWVVNNLVSITQQWYITRKIEQESS
ncbi:MAG: membrane protein insertase YidC [Candidatus Polarisedimenticolaceae bacterium]|nr:membrane protein insertase YidC [Candidatus Polarisedimenticolaceae bacterium]